MGKSGGGNSGKVEYPTYMQTQHEAWLDDIDTIIQTYVDPVANSPFDGESAYDPTTPLAANQTRFDTFDTNVSALDDETDWAAKLAVAGGQLSTYFASPASTVTTLKDTADPQADESVDLIVTAARTDITNIHSDASTNVLTEIDDVVDAAVTKAVDTSVDAVVETLIASYEDNTKDQYLRSINRFVAPMADINAVHSSTFVIGMALLEDGYNRDVRTFAANTKKELVDRYMNVYATMMNIYIATGAQLTRDRIANFNQVFAQYITAYIQNEQSKDQFLVQSTSEMMAALKSNINFEASAVNLQSEINRLKIVASKEQTDRDLELDVADAQWPFDVLLQGGNMLASISGAASTVNRPMSTAQSALSGALSFGAAGAQLGSAIPGVGSLAGFGIGAAAGVAQAFL